MSLISDEEIWLCFCFIVSCNKLNFGGHYLEHSKISNAPLEYVCNNVLRLRVLQHVSLHMKYTPTQGLNNSYKFSEKTFPYTEPR